MAQIQSNLFCIQVVSVAVPAYIAALSVGSWHELSSTSPSSNLSIPDLGSPFQSTGPRTLTDNWCGMAVRGLIDPSLEVELLFQGGGHADYAGNCVVGCQAERDEGPLWRVHTSNSDTSDIQPQSPGLSNGVRRYDDDRPSAHHSYYSLQYSDLYDEMIPAGRAALWGIGGGNSEFVERWRWDTKDWRPASECTAQLTGSTHTSGKCTHPVTGDIYSLRTGGYATLRRLNIADFSVSTVGNTNLTLKQYGPICVDPNLERMVVQVDDESWRLINLSNGSPTTLSVTGDTLFDFNAGNLVWDSDTDTIIGINSDFDVVRLDAATGEMTELDLGTKPPSANNGSTINGLFSKCAYIPKWKTLIAVPHWSANVWVARLS
jgi:hypothetical protein